MLYHFSLAILAAAVTLTPCRAAEPRPRRDDPAVSKVVTGAMEAMKRGDWKGFARLMHPEALRDLRNTLAPALKAAAENDPDELREVLRLFRGAKDVKAVLALSPEDFFISFLRGTTSAVPQFKKFLGSADFQVVGVVYEKGGLAHAVVRMRITHEDIKLTKMEVMTLKRGGEDWRLLMNAEFKGVAEQLRRSLKGK